jgi:membrane protein CcdC involved in cytochrome C biogenesis
MSVYLLPIIVFVVTSVVLYMMSSDPDKKKKPVKIVLPGLVLGAGSFFFMKYRDRLSPEPLMQGNYFD